MNIKPSLRLIDAQAAKTHGWQPVADHKFALSLPAVAVQLSEIGALVPTAPLAFAKLGPDQFALVAVTGFADGRNQLIDDQGRWCVQYQPIELRCYPFGAQPIAQNNEGPTTFGVCFNHDSGLYREAPDESLGQQRFFSDSGQPMPGFTQITELLRHSRVQQQLTQRAVKALQDAELMTPWQVTAPAGAGGESLPKGLYRVDEVKLNQLKGGTLEQLHQVHALGLAYAQLLSMSRLAVLKRLKDVHAAKRQGAQLSEARTPPAPDLALVKQLFEPNQSDTIKFNW